MRVTITVTCGAATYSFKRSVIAALSWLGVSPAAWTSSSSGTEILPSSRTSTCGRVSSVSRHTLMASVSLAPITYSACMAVAFSSSLLDRGRLAQALRAAAQASSAASGRVKRVVERREAMSCVSCGPGYAESERPASRIL